MQGSYHTLAQDHEFACMLQSVWQIELSDSTIQLYIMLVMYREPLNRIDSGYHVPSPDEIIVEFKAYFDPFYLSGSVDPSAVSEGGDSQRVRAEIIDMMCSDRTGTYADFDGSDVQGLLLQSIRNYLLMAASRDDNSSGTVAELSLAVPSEISDAVSRVCTMRDLISLQSKAAGSIKAAHYVTAWLGIHTCFEDTKAGPACECPFIYFFVKFCLDRGLGVPTLALSLYNRMNMLLARGFIRCGNPSCEQSRLDWSNGKPRLYKCTRCKVVAYCSRECQTAHYPKHMRICREHATVPTGS